MQVDFFNYALLLMSDILNWLMNLDAKKKNCQHLQCVGFIAIQIPYASFQAAKQIISFYLSSRVLHTAYIRLSWHGVRIRRNICLSNRRIWRGDVQKVHASLTWSEFSLKKYNNFLALSYVIKFHSIGVYYNDPRLHTIATFFKWERIIYFDRALSRICSICKLLIKVSL